MPGVSPEKRSTVFIMNSPLGGDSLDSRFCDDNPTPDKVRVRYLVTHPAGIHPGLIATRICKEQSLSWTLGDDEDVIDRFAAKYNSLEVPFRLKDIWIILFGYTRSDTTQASFDVLFPPHNTENSLSMILSAAAGDTYNIKYAYPVKVLSIYLPPSILEKYGGPRYGVEGLREQLGVFDRPISIGPVKPCIGLTPEPFAQRGKEAFLGGTDIVKDDELICNPDYNPLDIRVKTMVKARKEAEDATGRRKMYFAFVGGGSPLETIHFAEMAQENGADGIMVAPAINGYEIIWDLKQRVDLPIIAHNALTYASIPPSPHGIAFSVFVAMQRVCGADIIITPGKYGTFDIMSEEDHKANAQAALVEIPGIRRSFPAFSGGQSSATVLQQKEAAGSNDFAFTTGAALYNHPEGPKIGAAALIKTMEEVALITPKPKTRFQIFISKLKQKIMENLSDPEYHKVPPN